MDDYFRLLNSAAGIPLEWIVVFTFISVAVFYFLAPVLGYLPSSRGMLLTALYFLIACGVVTFFDTLLRYFLYLVMTNPSRIAKANSNLTFLFGILRLALYLAAQVALVLGLRKLQRNTPSTR